MRNEFDAFGANLQCCLSVLSPLGSCEFFWKTCRSNRGPSRNLLGLSSQKLRTFRRNLLGADNESKLGHGGGFRKREHKAFCMLTEQPLVRYVGQKISLSQENRSVGRETGSRQYYPSTRAGPPTPGPSRAAARPGWERSCPNARGVASSQAQPLLIWWRRDLGLGGNKNKHALIGQFKRKIPSRREVPPPEGWRATTPKWRRDVQPEENATSIPHLLNHDSCFAHVDSFRRMKRTSFTVSDPDG